MTLTNKEGLSWKPLTGFERDELLDRTKTKFVQMLGEPTKKNVAASMFNPHSISILEWLAVVLLIVIGIVTAFKMTSAAIPFAQSYYEISTDDTFGTIMVAIFSVFMSLGFILISTSGLIFFKLMDEDSSVEQLKKKYSYIKWYGGWQVSTIASVIIGLFTYYLLQSTGAVPYVVAGISWVVFMYKGGFPVNIIQWLSPRLFLFLVAIIMLWLVEVSSLGSGSAFEQYTIVVAELALAQVVANVLTKRSLWNAAVTDSYNRVRKEFDTVVENRFTDTRYLTLLYRELKETLVYVKRREGNKIVQPNLWLEQSNALDEIVHKEYKRLMSGYSFAKRVLQEEAEEVPDNVAQVMQVVEDNYKKYEDWNKALTPINEQGQFIPPHGDKHWTPETLAQSFMARALTKETKYTERNLSIDYAPNYGARAAWRSGAKQFFT